MRDMSELEAFINKQDSHTFTREKETISTVISF
jgi:hypothetical protein